MLAAIYHNTLQSDLAGHILLTIAWMAPKKPKDTSGY